MEFNENSHTYSCEYTPAAGDTIVKFTSGSVTWSTDMKSLNSGDSMYYTAYGNHNSSNAGYGTWGEVIEISVSSKTADVLPATGNVSSVYMVPDKNDSYSKVRMPFTNDRNKWVGYIAKEKADKMTFSFTNNNKNMKFLLLTEAIQRILLLLLLKQVIGIHLLLLLLLQARMMQEILKLVMIVW